MTQSDMHDHVDQSSRRCRWPLNTFPSRRNPPVSIFYIGSSIAGSFHQLHFNDDERRRIVDEPTFQLRRSLDSSGGHHVPLSQLADGRRHFVVRQKAQTTTTLSHHFQTIYRFIGN